MVEPATTEHEGFFPMTDWPRVTSAGRRQDEDSVAALDLLWRTYQRPLRMHLQFQFHLDEGTSEEWLQEFFLRKVQLGNVITAATRERGRFRTLLLNALDNFAISQIRRERSRRRHAEGQLEPLEPEGPNAPAAPGPLPGADFDLIWAQEVIAETLRRMEALCRAEDCSQRWGLFKVRLLDPLLDGTPVPRYDELVARFGFRSPSEASNTLLTAKRMFVRVAKEVLAGSCGGVEGLECGLGDLKAFMRRSI